MYKPTEAMAKAAKRGLEMRDKQPDSNKGGTAVGLARARQLVIRENLSEDTVKRMYSFFSRHEIDKSSESWKKGDSKGEQAWLLWGGDAGYSWSRRIVESLKKETAKNVLKKRDDGWHVLSEGGKNLGGPYATKEEAQKRLDDVEMFKRMKGNSMKLARVNNSLSTANMTIKRMHSGKINGKDLYADYAVIEGVSHMIRDSVMNGINYPAEVFDKLANSLMEKNPRIPAPLSHPSDEKGNFMDANDPITFSAHNVNAFDTDWRIDGDKLVSNTYINLDYAKTVNQAGWLVNRLKDKSPIDRSTGFYLGLANKEGVGKDGEPFNREVVEIYELNHSALLDPEIEPGAKTNADGVGMYCNAEGEHEILEQDLFANASNPAMNLPIAERGAEWDGAAAVKRIREYTNSTDKPSTNYRRYFGYFDPENVENFGAYKLPFADIINGKPTVIPRALGAIEGALSGARGETVDIPATDKDKVSSLVSHYKKKMEASNSKESAFNKALNYLKDAFGITDGYNSHSGVDAAINNADEDQRMKKSMMEKLKKNGYEVNEDMDDAKVMSMYEDMLKKNMGKKNEDDEEEDEKAMKMKNSLQEIVANALAPMAEELKDVKAQLNAKQDEEKSSLVDAVVNAGIGFDKEMAEMLPLEKLQKLAAANGKVVINAGGNHYAPDDDDGFGEIKMPSQEA